MYNPNESKQAKSYQHEMACIVGCERATFKNDIVPVDIERLLANKAIYENASKFYSSMQESTDKEYLGQFLQDFETIHWRMATAYLKELSSIIDKEIEVTDILAGEEKEEWKWRSERAKIIMDILDIEYIADIKEKYTQYKSEYLRHHEYAVFCQKEVKIGDIKME